MKIAVIADIHGNALALEGVLADIDRRGADIFCNLGDHFSGPLEPGRTFSILADKPFVSIRGNHDRYVIAKTPGKMDAIDRLAFDQIGEAGRQWIAALPETGRIEDALTLCHGTPSSDDLHWLFAKDAAKRFQLVTPEAIAEAATGLETPLICCGHSHVQRIVALPDGRRVFNPGSVGRPAFAMSDPQSAARVSPDAQYAMVERGEGGWSITLVAVPYDHESAARIAERNGAPQWAADLRAGWRR